jgi:F-type H+-transporting ATPase subunit gamma
MPSLKDLRNRIASVKATQKITKAMQMVAAAKLRKAQLAAEAARPYAEKMSTVMANVAAGAGTGADAPRLLAGTGKSDVHLLVVCSAERGLCGGFNSSIARISRDHANALKAQGKTVKIICVGKKAYDILRRTLDRDVIEVIDFRAIKQMSYAQAEQVAQNVLRRFEAGEFDVATLFFSRFRSVISQIPTAQRLIPADVPVAGEGAAASTMYDYEPGETEILTTLLPRNIAIQIFRSLLENAASEQGARMSAMDSATRNAGEMIKKQTQKYNRSRQAIITKELIEIISGAEAL